MNRFATPPELRDLAWIRGALQTVIALEHATMPVYCAAMFSLEVQNYPSYNAIRSVLMEEMAHMAAAANMLAALGGSPQIKGLDPCYPRSGLPGGVAPDLQLVLAQLSPRQLQNFMRLEAPAFMLAQEYRGQVYPTIGQLYGALRDAIVANADAVRKAVVNAGPANQVGGNIGFDTIVPTPGVHPADQLCQGIDDILAQGEGAGTDSIAAGEAFQNEGSHYARFAELWYGARYQYPGHQAELNRDTEKAYFQGERITWPVVLNTLAVPSDGYAAILNNDPLSAGPVLTDLEAFDAAYTAMMVHMDNMWNGPAETSWPNFGQAVLQMNELRVLSCFNIVRHQVPDTIIAKLPELYPDECDLMAEYTNLDRPVFYGPRFLNRAAGGRAVARFDVR